MGSLEETLAKTCQPPSVTDSILLVHRDILGDIAEIERERNLVLTHLDEQSTEILKKMRSEYRIILEGALTQIQAEKNRENPEHPPEEPLASADIAKVLTDVQEIIKRQTTLKMLVEVLRKINEILEKREY